MIFSHETRLTAHRYPTDGAMRLNETGQRMERLMQHYLVKLKARPQGDGVLFRDPMDGRIWEYQCGPEEPHGFTLPELVCLSAAEVERKYGGGVVGS